MTPPSHSDESQRPTDLNQRDLNQRDLNQRDLNQRDLNQRDLSLRLRELEAEVNQPPQHPVPHRRSLPRVWRSWLKVGQFVGVMIAVFVAFRIALWLANVVMLLAVAWVVYMLFFADDR